MKKEFSPSRAAASRLAHQPKPARPVSAPAASSPTFASAQLARRGPVHRALPSPPARRARPRQVRRAAWRAHAGDAGRVASSGPRKHARRADITPPQLRIPAVRAHLSALSQPQQLLPRAVSSATERRGRSAGKLPPSLASFSDSSHQQLRLVKPLQLRPCVAAVGEVRGRGDRFLPRSAMAKLVGARAAPVNRSTSVFLISRISTALPPRPLCALFRGLPWPGSAARKYAAPPRLCKRR